MMMDKYKRTAYYRPTMNRTCTEYSPWLNDSYVETPVDGDKTYLSDIHKTYVT
jgi:hypothetical protein